MFNCCMKNTTIDNLREGITQLKLKTVKTSEPSPDLTPDEIAKIKENLFNCGDFNFMIYTLQEETIMDVYGTLKGEQQKK